MKINKKDPKHLWALAMSGVNSFLVICLRPIVKIGKKEKTIVFYGHTLNGNLKPFFEYLSLKNGYKVYFLVLEKSYYDKVRNEVRDPESIVYSLNIKHMLKIASVDAFITSHGLHMFILFKWLTDAKFIDVWHAVSFKGWGKNGFRLQRSYDAVWVSSDVMRKMYMDRYKINPKKVKTTGYARTDQLVNDRLKRSEILSKYSIPKAKKYVLIAPTWAQDVKGRPLIPFGMDTTEFFVQLDSLVAKHDSHIIFRTHLNSGDSVNIPKLKHTSFMPYSKYEIVEEFLFIADILISDWSSVSIDYLPLRRPTLFLDVPLPYKHSLNIDSKYRFGDIVTSFDNLKRTISKYLDNPNNFTKKYKKDMDDATEICYGDTLDGKSTQRYKNRLDKLLS